MRAFAESEILPEEVKQILPKPEGSEEMAAALHNVTSGMCNTKQVKDTMESVMSGMYAALGIPVPTPKKKGEPNLPLKGILREPKSTGKPKDTNEADEEDTSGSGEGQPAWEGFNSDADGVEGEVDDDEDIVMEDSLDEEALSRYDDLLGGSSDEESFDEEEYNKNKPSHSTSTRQSLSLSPSPSESSLDAESESHPDLELASDSGSESESVVLPEPSKSTKQKRAPPPPKPSGSTFLPTLMGGYWSGSESAADIEDVAPSAPARKNRPGQMARRAIWEKKYGTGANHIKTGQGTVAEVRGKDDGWDSKKGAKDKKGRERRGGEGGRKRDFSQVTGENATPVEARKRGQGKKDDVGVLHPSWQAAKKAKELKKTAKFEGKKVTFD